MQEHAGAAIAAVGTIATPASGDRTVVVDLNIPIIDRDDAGAAASASFTFAACTAGHVVAIRVNSPWTGQHKGAATAAAAAMQPASASLITAVTAREIAVQDNCGSLVSVTYDASAAIAAISAVSIKRPHIFSTTTTATAAAVTQVRTAGRAAFAVLVAAGIAAIATSLGVVTQRGTGTAHTAQAKKRRVVNTIPGATTATSQATAAAGCKESISSSTAPARDRPGCLGHGTAAQQDEADYGRKPPPEPA